MTTTDMCTAIVSAQRGPEGDDVVDLPAELLLRLLGEARRIHLTGLKSYGLLVGDPGAPGFPYHATDVIFLDSRRNRRNDPENRRAFHAQGDYFRRYDDAGFVADPRDLLAAYRRVEDSGREMVALFHSHRRQPANFSHIDYRLHNPMFAWHLIISYRGGLLPRLQPFRVSKGPDDFGIHEGDRRQGSERTYDGPGVTGMGLRVHGDPADIRACTRAVDLGPGLGRRERGRRARSL